MLRYFLVTDTKLGSCGGVCMKKGYKILISFIALVLSIGATCIGCGFVGSSTLSFGIKFVYDFFFIMQTIATCWVVIAFFRKEKI